MTQAFSAGCQRMQMHHSSTGAGTHIRMRQHSKYAATICLQLVSFYASNNGLARHY